MTLEMLLDADFYYAYLGAEGRHKDTSSIQIAC